MSSILTRKLTARQLERNLDITLDELRNSKVQCQQLLLEREDNEREVLKILEQDKNLKMVMAEMHTELLDVVSQRDRLQKTIDTFDQCSGTFEDALQRIAALESELHDAQNQILVFEQANDNLQSSRRLSLFDELVSVAPKMVCGTLRRVTSDDLIGCGSEKSNLSGFNVHFNSRNKLKKYLKLKKFIKKYRKKSYKHYKMQIFKCNKECFNLQQQLKISQEELENIKSSHDSDTLGFQSDIHRLQESLHEITSKYALAVEQISEQAQAADQLVDLCNYNEQRFESLLNSHSCDCKCSLTSANEQSVLHATTEGQSVDRCGSVTVENYGFPENYNTIMFSDRLGKNFGIDLRNNVDHRVINICLPEGSFSQIVNRIKQTKFNSQTNIIILLGNGINIRKSELVNSIEYLLALEAKKVMLCAFPYSASFTPSQNKYIHCLNTLMFNVSCRHSDTLLFFDTNKFIGNFKMTKDAMYLPKKSKANIAKLIAYNLNHYIQCLNIHPLTTESLNSTILPDTTGDGNESQHLN